MNFRQLILCCNFTTVQNVHYFRFISPLYGTYVQLFLIMKSMRFHLPTSPSWEIFIELSFHTFFRIYTNIYIFWVVSTAFWHFV